MIPHLIPLCHKDECRAIQDKKFDELSGNAIFTDVSSLLFGQATFGLYDYFFNNYKLKMSGSRHF